MNPRRSNTATPALSFRRRTLGPPARATLLVLWAATQGGRALAQDAPAPAGTALPTVTVTADSNDDTPQHLGAQVSSGALGDVFAQDASVSDNSGAYNSWASYITVRGLPLDWP